MRDEFLRKWQGVVQRGVRWSAASSVVLQVFSLAKAIVIGRVLGAEAVGLYALLQIAATFGARFSDFGLSNSVIHYRDLSREQLGGLYIVNVFGGLLIAVLVMSSGDFFVPRLAPYLPYVGLTIFLKSLAQQYQYLFQRDHDLKMISLVEVASVGIGELCCILLLWQGHGLWAVVWGLALTALLYLIGFWLTGVRAYGAPQVFNPSFVNFQKLLNWGFFQMGEGLLGYWSQRADRIILATFVGLEFLGYYTLAIQLITKPYHFIGSITARVFQPIYSSVAEGVDAVNQIYLNNTKAIASVLFPLYGLMGLQANWLIHTLYGAGWEAAVPLLQALCVLGAAKSIYVNIGSYLLGIGKPDLGFYLNIYNSLMAVGLIGIGIGFFAPTQGVFIYGIGVAVLAMPADLYVRAKGSEMQVWPFLRTVGLPLGITLLGILTAALVGQVDISKAWQQFLLESGLYVLTVGGLSYLLIFKSSLQEVRNTMWLGRRSSPEIQEV